MKYLKTFETGPRYKIGNKVVVLKLASPVFLQLGFREGGIYTVSYI